MTQPTQDAIEAFDLAHPPAGFIDDPFPWYAALRENDPIHRCPDGSYLRDALRRLSAGLPQLELQLRQAPVVHAEVRRQSPLFNHHTTSLVFNDPPYHTRVRATLAEALKPKTIEPTIAALERVVAAAARSNWRNASAEATTSI